MNRGRVPLLLTLPVDLVAALIDEATARGVGLDRLVDTMVAETLPAVFAQAAHELLDAPFATIRDALANARIESRPTRPRSSR